MKAGTKLLIPALALLMTGCATSTNTRLTQLENRVRTLENNQNVALARIQVSIHAAEQSPRHAELEADGTLQTLRWMAKVFEQPPQEQHTP